MTRPLKILITNVYLVDRAGTEMVVRDLALGLLAAGHYPMVYSPRLGAVAHEIAEAGVPVADDLRRLPDEPDVIHGHHHVETVRALLHFPRTPAIYVCHDRTAWVDVPPVFPRILRYVAVDLNCRERLMDTGGIPEDSIRIIGNAFDDARFTLRLPLPPFPRRAVIFSNYAVRDGYLETVRAACQQLGIELDVIGMATGTHVDRPETILGRYDLVFAKARCALEAMATGAAVILCDSRGLGPMVTSEEVERLRALNFGMRCLCMPHEPSLVAQQVKRFDPVDASAVSSYIRRNARLSDAVDTYVDLYREVLSLQRDRNGSGEEELNSYLEATVRRSGHLEIENSRFLQRDRVPPIPLRAYPKMRIRIIEAPARVRSGEEFAVRVEFENRTPWRLGTFPPLPLYFTYRWLSGPARNAAAGALLTPLSFPVEPGSKGIYYVRVAAPAAQGNFRLRLTFVQEGFRRFDSLFPRVCADVRIEVQ